MKRIKFAVFTDLHYDHIHDGDVRLERFARAVRNIDLDFIIQLGDFCYPIDENKPLITRLEDIGVPYYSVIGNHDTDCFPVTQVMKFLGMPHNFYSFIKGNVKFIVLDACYIQTLTGYEPYIKRNYHKSNAIYPIIPPEELDWLENEFEKRGIYNRSQVRAIINRANEMNKKVLLCMNGHDHGNSVSKIGDTYYYALNVMSYIWYGPQFEHFTYPKEIHERYPYLKDVVSNVKDLYFFGKAIMEGKLVSKDT